MSLPANFVLVLLLASFALTSCGDGGGNNGKKTPNAPPASLYKQFPIDGQVDLSKLPSINTRTVNLKGNFGTGNTVKTTELKWGFINDDKDIYIAAQWTDANSEHFFDIKNGPVQVDGIKFLFDDDNNGLLDNNDDERTLIAASVSSQYIDQHASAGDETDSIGDGLGRLSYDTTTQTYSAEILFPLKSDTNQEDANLVNNTRYNILIFDNLNFVFDAQGNPSVSSANVGSAFASQSNSATWGSVTISNEPPRTRPVLPTNLTGLIAFISEHEVPINGEIYTFDPSTRITTKITNNPTLFKDNLSLSNDRTKITFHGSPNKDMLTQYEIYSIHVDGTNLQRLTNNAILDGHPAWSPDDTRIAYASFRNSGKEVIVTMTANGTEIAALPTPAGKADNDPDYLPDGRIIFKTDRFNTSPKVQIAVMNEDGSNIKQVTSTDNVSDHDPVGDSQFTIFERFPKSTAFNTDVESGFIGWNIVEAKLDGSSENTIVTDEWINWLPLYDPTGKYIAYQRTTGAYTDVQLMTRSGDNLGRLIPDITKIRYIDWK